MNAETVRKTGYSVLCAYYNWLYTQLTCLGSANLSSTGRGLKAIEPCKAQNHMLATQDYIPSRIVGKSRLPKRCSEQSLGRLGCEKMHKRNKKVGDDGCRLNTLVHKEVVC